MQKVFVLNGPNLGRLGSREPDIYGAMDFDALTSAVNAKASFFFNFSIQNYFS